MTSAISPDRAWLILDVCCIINLAATQVMAEILRSLGMRVAVAAYVREKELGPSVHASPANRPIDGTIDLQALINEGLIEVVDLAGLDEHLMLLTLAQRLDDGEAITGAIATLRQWAIATDDRVGRTVLAQQAPDLQMLSTPELLYHWPQHANPTDEDLRDVLNAIRVEARYVPPRSHPLAGWWADHA